MLTLISITVTLLSGERVTLTPQELVDLTTEMYGVLPLLESMTLLGEPRPLPCSWSGELSRKGHKVSIRTCGGTEVFTYFAPRK